MTNSDHDKTLRKFRRERAVGRLLNPAVKGLSKLGLRTALATELETVGRKTGQVRRVPVSAQFDHDGAWIISQHGTRSGLGSKHRRQSECSCATRKSVACRSGEIQT